MIPDQTAVLRKNTPLSPTVSLLRFEADTARIEAPGQFVMLTLPDRFLRRPFSICDWDDGWFSVIVERVGAGTAELQALRPGTELPTMSGLGHGFTWIGTAKQPLLAGGGTGLSPLVGLARRLRTRGVTPKVLLGFRDAQTRFGWELFPDCSVEMTEDLFTAMADTEHDYVYACGSRTFVTELAQRSGVPGQMAFDVRMGCGIGACMGCSVATKTGMKRVCHEGPVFRKEDLL